MHSYIGMTPESPDESPTIRKGYATKPVGSKRDAPLEHALADDIRCWTGGNLSDLPHQLAEGGLLFGRRSHERVP